MVELDKKEMVIRFSAIGLVLGSLLAVIIYLMLFNALEIDFTFREISLLHHKLWSLYLIDSLPVPGIITGIILGLWRYNQMNMLYARLQQDSEINSEIKLFTHTLIAGDLSASISFKHTDQTLSDSLNKLKDTLVRNREMEGHRRLEDRPLGKPRDRRDDETLCTPTQCLSCCLARHYR